MKDNIAEAREKNQQRDFESVQLQRPISTTDKYSKELHFAPIQFDI